MRAAFEHIVPTSQLSWKMFVARAPRFRTRWHFHAEFELVLIVDGSGTCLVGDCVHDYNPGDILLIGRELPHAFISVPGQGDQEAIVVQFRRDFLGADFFDRPEFAEAAALLEAASRGITFPNYSAELPVLNDASPAKQTLRLLRLLVRLSDSHDARLLASPHYTPALHRVAGAQLEAMLGVIHDAYTRPLGLDEVAAAAHMTPSSASRFFRRTTGTTITDYLNALRVNAACRLLRETDRRIADIAADCGYANLANFNRRFRDLRGMSPREYRNQFLTTSQ